MEQPLPIEKSKRVQYWNEDDRMNILGTLKTDVTGLILEGMALRARVFQTEERAKKETKDLLLRIVEILDAFENLFKNIEPKEAMIDHQTKIWLNNFRSIRKLGERFLREKKVVPITTPTGRVIPGYHTVIEVRTMEGCENDTIIEEREKGYLWNDEVLRKASVVAVKNE